MRTTVTFSEEERQIIRENNLEDEIVLERDPPAILIERGGVYVGDLRRDYWLRVKHLQRGTDEWSFYGNGEAKIYEAELRDALSNLKAFLDGSADPSEVTTFEL